MAIVDLFCFLLFCHLVLILSAGYGNGHQDCPHSFTCGNLGTFHYPFTKAEKPDCGLLAIHDCDNPHQHRKMIQLELNGKGIVLIGVAQQNAISILDEDFHKRLQQNPCGTLKNNYSLPSPFSSLYSIHIKFNVTLFKCKQSLKMKPPTHYFNHPCPEYDYDIYYDSLPTPNSKEAHSLFSSCSVIQISTKDLTDTNDILSFVSAEMVLQVVLSNDCDQCYNHRGGQCRLDANQKFYCKEAAAPKNKSKILKLVLVLGLVTAVTIALLLVMVKIYHTRWKQKQNPTNQQIKIFLERQGPLQTKRYDYSEIKKVTNSFRNKLGQGGFGSVYKGKLPDGRYLAVKILSELKDNGEDFINEVATISRTSHINIVNLLGFCCEGSKRALVYEFMSNGSLEKFIFEENVGKTDRQLDCQTIYHIAVGVARGLEYLHQGCNTRILHFDIKPHNILLDENFNPKISDFGLAKICTRKESMISIFGARGTAGYIAPEVFSRNFGAVSHKSDVYSYGMMILEMAGRRKNIKTEVNRSSEIYFPDWIYNCLESNEELGLQNIRNESDDKLVRKMTIVGLWCIQTHPSTRPAISKVLEMLGSKVELLQIPPKPFLSSPPTSPVHLSYETL
ncbi:LEAF RUST 10 DISEASE-RESISTANCE LOCUS RECEPTOR-LIKE PROTEIN KINASE-like 2.4 isoform X1 [Glycine soja]|uniref:LEAF RUST 10 DISEASE-RESISTANCE LOCUS RECEPTOR-LIKE PROTEIN KINASE-like 2.4 isoform X1 n=1 Tax=Glycine soja TaxID=3848 RepID=UPI00103F56AC|nr:LEAF RUST 10 DISEASE-RESISTANCE LOCUS RECEPTOR-LIKE PROTEIN KINASE-like 2.4 isoform X1 [Glycine soja]